MEEPARAGAVNVACRRYRKGLVLYDSEQDSTLVRSR
jgi:hypothetical protein